MCVWKKLRKLFQKNLPRSSNLIAITHLKKAWLDEALCFGGEKSSHLDITLHLKPSEMFFFLLAILGILVPWPRIEPEPPVVEVQSLNHWTTREVPGGISFYPHLTDEELGKGDYLTCPRSHSCQIRELRLCSEAYCPPSLCHLCYTLHSLQVIMKDTWLEESFLISKVIYS